MNIKLIILIFLSFLFSCKKEKFKLVSAQVVSFNPDKCGCCWGWTIITDNMEIKSDNSEIGDLAGYEINEPIDITMKIESNSENCSNYYEIKNIELVN